MIRSASLTLACLLLVVPQLTLAQSVSPPAEPHDPLPLPPNDDDPLAAARAFDARADYQRASDAYEDYASSCLDSATAVLRAGAPCAEVSSALTRAFELRRALSDSEGAVRVAHAFTAHFLYAQPREAIGIGYALVQMQLGRGALDEAQAELDRLIRSSADPPAGLSLLADALRAQIATERGNVESAARYWRRVERRFEREQDALLADGTVPEAWVHSAVAEGRLVRAERSVNRFLATQPPRAHRTEADQRWWRRTMSPWLVRSRRRLLLARLELERVYELGSPRHSVIAAARIGEMYQHRADLHARLALPENDWVRTLVHQGDDRPGYEEARTHLETCVSWATHHAVAREWASRCETDLHALDPHRYPVPAELHGQATYHPVSAAAPSEPAN